ncbi:MAG: hypothetical protein ABFS39_02650 [Pseudomonadota bacterium]
MDFRAILIAILMACGLAGALMSLAAVLDVTTLSAPRILTLFALWMVPGYYAAIRAAHAGALHGMLTGLLGMLIIYFGFDLFVSPRVFSAADILAAKSAMIFTVLAGFWGSVGGMIADSVHLIKAKRASRKARESSSNPK